jgi:hypothetical protein
MTDTFTNPRTVQPPSLSAYTPSASQSFPIGTAVAQDASTPGSVIPADAGGGDIALACTLGIAIGAGVVDGGPVPVQYLGPVHLTTAEWDVITGQTGGLTAGSRYFTSHTDPGKLVKVTSITPGDFIVFVGTATSPTDLFLAITFPREIA